MAVALAVIFFSMILVDNYVLVQFLGICPFLGVSKRLDSAVGMSLAVTFVMVLATAATWPIQMFLLTPESGAWDMGYLQTIVFILIIAVLVQLLEIILKKYIPALYKSLGVYLPLITTNCTILGVTVLNIDNGYDFLESIVNAVGAGLGFLVAMVLFSGVRRKVEEAMTPSASRVCPSPWWPPRWPPCPSWASAVSWRTSLALSRRGSRDMRSDSDGNGSGHGDRPDRRGHSGGRLYRHVCPRG